MEIELLEYRDPRSAMDATLIVGTLQVEHVAQLRRSRREREIEMRIMMTRHKSGIARWEMIRIRHVLDINTPPKWGYQPQHIVVSSCGPLDAFRILSSVEIEDDLPQIHRLPVEYKKTQISADKDTDNDVAIVIHGKTARNS
jgi:hypothetical protein